MSLRYTQPQIGPIEARSDVHSALTPTTEKGGRFRLVKGSAWTANNTGALSTTVRKSGTVVVNSSNGYWSRANPFQSGPLTVCFIHTPSTVTGTVGLWSLADTFQSGGPYFLIQRAGADLRIFTGSDYKLTATGVFSVGVPAKIALSIFKIEAGYTQSNFIAVNGVLYALNTYTSSGTTKPNEFIGSGYNGQGAGDYGEYFALQRKCSNEELISFTKNPYQLFRPKYKTQLLPTITSGAYTLTTQAGTYTAAGQNAQLRKSKLLSTSGGTYALSGSTVSLLRSRKLTSSGGAYLETGSDASLYRSRQLSLTGGSYSIDGASVDITFTGLSANFTLTAQGGMYSLVGSSADITYTALSPSYLLIAQGGTYTASGNSIALRKSRRLTASGGVYSYTGQQVNITAGPAVVSTLLRYINILTGEVMILKPF